VAANSPSTTIYRYGALAWVWRVLMLLGLALAAPLLALWWRDDAGWGLLAALPLIAPTALLAGAVAVRIDEAGDHLDVWTLGGWRRRVARGAVGPGRIREYAQGDLGAVRAPRAFVRVRGGLPIYVDLLADIPDRARLVRTLQLTRP
jgi:hypothetical protein